MRRVLRQERKFLVDLATSSWLQGRLRAVLREDEHNGPLGYRVRSLYFDTLHSRDFAEKLMGTNPRRKVRLRVYDPSSARALLEVKQKDGENQLKRSLPCSRAEAESLIEGNPSWMLARPEPFARELYGLIRINGYRPVSVVEYRRRAFVARELRTRVTFDGEIRSTEASLDVFDPGLCLHPVLDPFSVVLEVKYNGFLLSYIKDQLNAAEKREISVSKYALSRDVTMGYQF
ncbi:polyphosphate polymerase domain-containing protein [Thermophilibacter sp.]